MKLPFHALVLVALTLLLAFGNSGCTAKMRKARHLERANRQFKAQAYDNAEIEYLNVLKLEPLNPESIAQLALMYFEQGRLGRVYAFLSKARELQPENLEVRIRLGQLFLASGRGKDAQAEAMYVLQKRPNDPDAPLLLAESVTDATQLTDVRNALEALPASSKNTAPVLTALGTLELRQRKPADAIALFERALAADPKHAAAHVALGTVYAAQNDQVRAEKAFAAGAAHSPIRSPKRIHYARYKMVMRQFDSAKADLRDIVTKAPDFLTAWLLLAEIELTQQNYDDAAADITKVLGRDPLHPDASLLSGRISLAKGDFDKAIADLSKATATYSRSAGHLHLLGRAYAAKGDLGKAVASLNQAIAAVPNYAPAILSLAEINLRQNNPGAAVAALQQLIQKQPALVEARLLLGNAYTIQRKYDDAVIVYQQLQQTFPQNAQIPFLIGMVQVEQGKLPAAAQSFERALEIKPDFTPALEQIVNIDLRKRDYVAARARVNAYIKKNPNAAGGYLVLAKSYIDENDTANAEAAFQKAIALQPQETEPYFLLARLYLRTKQQDKAIANLQLVAKNDPKNAQARLMIGVLYAQQENYAAARDAYESVLAINPKLSAALNNLAYLYSERFNEPGKAFELAQRARDLLPGEPHAADTLGWILYKRKDYAWALSLLAEAADKLPGSADIQYHVGMAHYMLGEEQPARAALERALKLNAEFAGANDAKRALSILNAADTDPETVARLEKAVAQGPDTVAYNRLAAVYMRQGDSAKAMAAYESALKASSKNVQATLGMIRLYRQRKDSAKALELAKSARKFAPTSPEVAQVLGELVLQSGDHGWAASLLQEAMRDNPDDPETLYSYAQAAYYTGQVDAADEAYRRALEVAPTFPQGARIREAVEMIALASNARKAAAAEAKITQALKTSPDDGAALMAYGAMKQQQRDITGAIETYERLLNRYPDFSPARKELVILLAEQRPADPKSLEIATKAREQFPNDPDVAKASGIIAFRQSNFSRAAALLEESARARTADADVMYYLGMAQKQLKNGTASQRSLQRALELNLRPDLAAKARETLAQSK
jgi:tetratricopeptide (TPR) repeat protein